MKEQSLLISTVERPPVEEDPMFTQIAEWLEERPRVELSLLMKPRLAETDEGGREWAHDYILRVRDDSVCARRYVEVAVNSVAIEQALREGRKPLTAALAAMTPTEEQEFFQVAPAFKAVYESLELRSATADSAAQGVRTQRAKGIGI